MAAYCFIRKPLFIISVSGLGHGDIETTLKTYTHVLTEMRHEEEQLRMNRFKQPIM